MTGKKIRVLHIAQAAGGVDRYLRMLLKYMDKEQFENIVVFSQSFDKKDYEGLVDGYETVQMYRSIGMHDVKSVFRIRKLIKEYQPDIVYAHSSKAGAVGRLADIGLNNKCIYNPHGWAFNMRCSKRKKLLYTFIEKIAAHFCDKIVCISDAEKRSAVENKICSKRKLQVIYNGVDIEEYESKKIVRLTRKKIEIPDNAFVIGMVGRLSPQKAPDIFVEMAVQVKKIISNAYFVIVGSGEMEEEIKKYACDNGIDNCLCVTGWVDDPMDYVELFDVACLLSRWEGFGLVLPEYMMAGKPIVATNVDAIPNIVTDGKTGLLVEMNNVPQICECVKKLYMNEKIRREMSECEKKCVKEKFNISRVVNQHEKLFEEIVYDKKD